MKKIELTAEWILNAMSTGWMTEGTDERMVVLNCTEILETRFIDLALKSMGIECEAQMMVDEDDEFACWQYRFNFEKLAGHCQSLYEEMEENNHINSIIKYK